MKAPKRISYLILDKEGNIVGDIDLDKRWVKVIGEMLRIYCKYRLRKNE